MNRFQFVEDHKDAYGVKRLCEVVEIGRSSFYAWLAAARDGQRGPPKMLPWRRGSGCCRTPRRVVIALTGHRGSLPTSTTASPPPDG